MRGGRRGGGAFSGRCTRGMGVTVRGGRCEGRGRWGVLVGKARGGGVARKGEEHRLCTAAAAMVLHPFRMGAPPPGIHACA